MPVSSRGRVRISSQESRALEKLVKDSLLWQVSLFWENCGQVEKPWESGRAWVHE